MTITVLATVKDLVENEFVCVSADGEDENETIRCERSLDELQY